MQSLESPYLQSLAEGLPQLALSSKAPSTTLKYSRAFDRWKRWASRFPEVQAFPASPLGISLYLNDLRKESGSKSAMEAAVYGLKWVHEMAGLDNPTDHPLVRSVLEGAHRQLGKPINKKEPVTVEMLQKLVEQFGGSGASLSDIRSLALCLLAFSGFLRYDEIVRCRFSDIKFCEDYMELFIASSKTDKLRNGETLVIAKTRNPTCPVSMLKRYIVMTKEPANAPNWLFRPINAKQQSLREGRLSYTRVRELVLSMLKHVVEDVSGLGCTAYAQVALLQQQMQEFRTDISRDMDAGSLRQLRMVTSKIPWRLDCKCHKSWVCNLSYILLCYLQAFIWGPVLGSLHFGPFSDILRCCASDTRWQSKTMHKACVHGEVS